MEPLTPLGGRASWDMFPMQPAPVNPLPLPIRQSGSEHSCWWSISHTPPLLGQSLMRQCPRCGTLFRWNDPGWVVVNTPGSYGPVGRWLHRKDIGLDPDWLADDRGDWGKRPTFRLRRLLLRLRGWDA